MKTSWGILEEIPGRILGGYLEEITGEIQAENLWRTFLGTLGGIPVVISWNYSENFSMNSFRYLYINVIRNSYRKIFWDFFEIFFLEIILRISSGISPWIATGITLNISSGIPSGISLWISSPGFSSRIPQRVFYEIFQIFPQVVHREKLR